MIYMIDTVVVSGGNIEEDFALDFLHQTEKKRKGKLCLFAADRGVEFFMHNGLIPDIAVGDFDSLSDEGKRYLKSLKRTEIVGLRPEKDDSDTQSAVNLAIRRGAREIAVLGGTGTRLDHVLANLGLLLEAKEKGAAVCLRDAHNEVRLVDSGTVLQKKEQFGKYVSFFCIGGDVTGLTLEGFKYPLTNHHLQARESGLTVSNEILAEEAKVTFASGNLLMLMTRD